MEGLLPGTADRGVVARDSRWGGCCQGQQMEGLVLGTADGGVVARDSRWRGCC